MYSWNKKWSKLKLKHDKGLCLGSHLGRLSDLVGMYMPDKT